MKREAISFVLAMAVTTCAAALSAPTLVVNSGGAKQVEQGDVGARKAVQPTNFEPGKNRQQWLEVPLPENLTRGRGLVRA